MWSNLKWTGVVAAAIVVAACDRTPVEPVPQVESPGDALAAAIVKDSWDLLPSAEEVQLTAIEALSTASASAAADALIIESGDLAAEADAAAQAGEAIVAEVLASGAEEAYFEAVVATLGPSFAAQAISNVQMAVGQVEAALVGNSTSPAVGAAVNDARELIDQAASELSRGNDAVGLRDGIAAADALRDVSPEDRAKHVVEMALRLLGKAKELAGSNPPSEIAEILRDADEHCDAAVTAVGSGHWEIAVREARECARLARRVIRLLSGDIPDDRLEGHAHTAIENAEDLLHRAIGLAGDDPIPEVEEALSQAAEYLRQAREAFEHEHWREVIRLARESAAISRRVIGFLTHDRPSDGLEARAEQAIQHAKDLFDRASELAGDPPRPEIAEYLGQARELIAEADVAFEEHHWREAIAKAHQASRILGKIIRLLSDTAVITDRI